MSGIFLGGKISTVMKVHNIAYLRRLARAQKKEHGITHHESLDKIARNLGYKNWKHLLHENVDKNIVPITSPDMLEQCSPFDSYKKLLIASVNELLDSQLISLEPKFSNPAEEKGFVFVSLFGEPSVIIWSNRGFDELFISVWWKYDREKFLKLNKTESYTVSKPLVSKSHYNKFVGVVMSCWLERREGKYLQINKPRHISNLYVRRGELENIKKLPPQNPKGYAASGAFHI